MPQWRNNDDTYPSTGTNNVGGAGQPNTARCRVRPYGPQMVASDGNRRNDDVVRAQHAQATTRLSCSLWQRQDGSPTGPCGRMLRPYGGTMPTKCRTMRDWPANSTSRVKPIYPCSI